MRQNPSPLHVQTATAPTHEQSIPPLPLGTPTAVENPPQTDFPLTPELFSRRKACTAPCSSDSTGEGAKGTDPFSHPRPTLSSLRSKNMSTGGPPQAASLDATNPSLAGTKTIPLPFPPGEMCRSSCTYLRRNAGDKCRSKGQRSEGAPGSSSNGRGHSMTSCVWVISTRTRSRQDFKQPRYIQSLSNAV